MALEPAYPGGPQRPSPALHHRYIDCPKRKRLALREYSGVDALRATIDQFRKEAAMLDTIAADLAPAAEAHRKAKDELLTVEGKLQFIAHFLEDPARARAR